MKKKSFTIIFFFIFCYFIVRLPSLIAPLSDEEGTHAFVFCCNPPAPKYLWVAVINGQGQFDAPQHPALIYEMLSTFGAPWQVVIGANRGVNPLLVSLIVRFAFALFQFTYFLLLLILLQRSEDASWRNKITWVVIVLALGHIGIYASMSVQVDGSLGSLLPGLVILSLLVWHEDLLPPKWIYTLLFVFAAFLGFGKNEWGLALLASLAVTGSVILLASRFYRGYDKSKTDLILLGVIICGLGLGNLINYLYDPKNYLDGIALMRGLSGYKSNVDPLIMLIERVKSLYLNILMLIIVGVGVIFSLKKNMDAVLILMFIWGGILFSAYFMAEWGWALKRYYAPSFVVLVGAIVLVSKYYPERVAQYVFAGLTAVTLMGTSLYVGTRLGNLKDYSLLFTQQTSPQVQTADACIPLLNDGEAFANGANDFISRSMGEAGGSKLASQFGKTICK